MTSSVTKSEFKERESGANLIAKFIPPGDATVDRRDYMIQSSNGSGGNMRPPAPPRGEPHGDNGGNMNAWEASVETRLGELSTRFLWLAGGFAIAFVFLVGLIIARTDTLSDRVGKLEVTVSRLDERTESMSAKLDKTDAKLDTLDGKLDTLIAKK